MTETTETNYRDAGYRAAIVERKNNRSGALEIAIRFTHPATPLVHSKVVWFDLKPGESWFSDRNEHNYFQSFLHFRYNCAIKCPDGFRQAAAFLEHLKPAQIGKPAQF